MPIGKKVLPEHASARDSDIAVSSNLWAHTFDMLPETFLVQICTWKYFSGELELFCGTIWLAGWIL